MSAISQVPNFSKIPRRFVGFFSSQGKKCIAYDVIVLVILRKRFPNFHSTITMQLENTSFGMKIRLNLKY